METPDIDNLLPELFIFSGGEWEPYGDAIYAIFKDTLLKNDLYFQGLRVGIRREPEYKGKHFTFWHLTSEGEKEEERTPDLRRCERLSWVRWVLKNCDSCTDISWWENNRGTQKHIVIWHEKAEYAVILAKRKNYYLLKTAYVVKPRRAEYFRRERDSFRKSKS